MKVGHYLVLSGTSALYQRLFSMRSLRFCSPREGSSITCFLHCLARGRRERGTLAGRARAISTAAARAMGAAAVFRAVSDYWFGTSSTRRFWARPSRVLLVATKSVLP